MGETMKCLQCEADLLDSATSCGRCGAPTRATTFFSYLPSGAPPWPATIPQATSFTTTAVKEPAQAVATARSVPDAKPKRSVGSIFATFLLLILSIVIGVGATLAILAANGSLGSTTTTPKQALHLAPPMPTAAATVSTGTATPGTGIGTPTAATPTPASPGNQLPTPTSFQVVKIAQLGFSVKYPVEWTQDPLKSTTGGNLFIDFHPPQQVPVDFTVGRLSAQNSATVTSADMINQANLQIFSTDPTLRNYQGVHPANPTPTIAGIQWTEGDATFTNPNNAVIHFVIISAKHNNFYYSISYFAVDTVFGEAMQKYIQPMLASFQFLA